MSEVVVNIRTSRFELGLFIFKIFHFISIKMPWACNEVGCMKTMLCCDLWLVIDQSLIGVTMSHQCTCGVSWLFLLKFWMNSTRPWTTSFTASITLSSSSHDGVGASAHRSIAHNLISRNSLKGIMLWGPAIGEKLRNVLYISMKSCWEGHVCLDVYFTVNLKGHLWLSLVSELQLKHIQVFFRFLALCHLCEKKHLMLPFGLNWSTHRQIWKADIKSCQFSTSHFLILSFWTISAGRHVVHAGRGSIIKHQNDIRNKHFTYVKL